GTPPSSSSLTLSLAPSLTPHSHLALVAKVRNAVQSSLRLQSSQAVRLKPSPRRRRRRRRRRVRVPHLRLLFLLLRLHQSSLPPRSRSLFALAKGTAWLALRSSTRAPRRTCSTLASSGVSTPPSTLTLRLTVAAFASPFLSTFRSKLARVPLLPVRSSSLHFPTASTPFSASCGSVIPARGSLPITSSTFPQASRRRASTTSRRRPLPLSRIATLSTSAFLAAP
ncbi:hypothetical protein DMC30DRAFT_405729, partial [Rhodotorula diobovata]